MRLPAALTVPGDTLAGAAAAGWPLGRRTYALPVASACLYWAGMALNDYADRELDAVERPERPIPSGRVRPGEALALAAGLTAAGVAVAGAAGGRRSAGTATALAAAVWGYDLVLKPTPLGPPGMAATRALDVLLGAGPRPRAAALPAAAMAVHTLGVTTLSRGEVHGGSRATAGTALAATATAALLAASPVHRGAGRRVHEPTVAATALFATRFASAVGAAQARAASDPRADTVRSATGAGIHGMIPLQAALIARTGALAPAAVLLAATPVAAAASKVVSPT
ncbi:SCO3242 family prenyltransferase [Nocardiopsis sediminis]|uniref:SCO3242 family prenyltransferase n=1 Tax=Nocardiopsis sediminis TaxID=1778267 RepID=A0ABV8FI17_9ACTN